MTRTPLTTTIDAIRQLRVAVLCGGDSPERTGSLASGRDALEGLQEFGCEGAALFDLAAVSPSYLALTLKERFDLALLALHGPGGEDGKIQGFLETLGIPYTGSGVLASAIGMHKPTFKRLMPFRDIPTPQWQAFDLGTPHSDLVNELEFGRCGPVFIKPASGGGSLAASLVRDDEELRERILAARDEPFFREYLMESLTDGHPCTVAVLQNSDGSLHCLPVLHVETDREFYDWEAKHDPSQRREYCPSTLPQPVIARMQHDALDIFEVIKAHGFLRVDFMATPERAFVLEVNTLPGLSRAGNLATAATAAGIGYPELIARIALTALNKPSHYRP